MQVIIQAQPDASGAIPTPYLFSLSSGGRESPDKLTINGQRNTEPFFGLRAPTAQYVDRYNARTTVSFSVTRLHDTTSDAQEYMLLHQSNIPGGGTVIFYNESGSKFYMRNSVLQTTEQKHTGRTTFHTYNLVGGLITAT